MGSSEIWDKYHEFCIGNGPEIYNKSSIIQISLLLMLFPCSSQLSGWDELVSPCMYKLHQLMLQCYTNIILLNYFYLLTTKVQKGRSL